MIIDTHAHLVPQAMLDALKKEIGRFPNIELLHEGDSWRMKFADGPMTRPVAAAMRDTDNRLSWMDDTSVDVQVCGGWIDAFGYELPPDEGEAWARFTNEFLLSCTDGNQRLAPIGTVPLQSGKHAARVLEDAMKDGCHGLMLGTQPHGLSGNLDDPDLDPFWEAASDLKAALFMHPMFGCGDARLADYGLINAVGRGTDTTTAIARMMFSGHFERFPGITMVLSHGGGGLPYLLARLKRNHEITPGTSDPQVAWDKLYFDSVLFDPRTMRYLADLAGADRIVLGSDYPFPIGDLDPTKAVRATKFTEDETDAILGNTAAALFHIHDHG